MYRSNKILNACSSGIMNKRNEQLTERAIGTRFFLEPDFSALDSLKESELEVGVRHNCSCAVVPERSFSSLFTRSVSVSTEA